MYIGAATRAYTYIYVYIPLHKAYPAQSLPIRNPSSVPFSPSLPFPLHPTSRSPAFLIKNLEKLCVTKRRAPRGRKISEYQKKESARARFLSNAEHAASYCGTALGHCPPPSLRAIVSACCPCEFSGWTPFVISSPILTYLF